jgi:hypothetical protein
LQKKLPGLDTEVMCPQFKVKKPEGFTDEEFVAEVERKVFLMIGNYTHRDHEASLKILGHKGRVNCVFNEMKI